VPAAERSSGNLHAVLTVAGVVVLSFMMAMYALEAHSRRFVLLLAVGCRSQHHHPAQIVHPKGDISI
jgi:hypothetical protein